MTHAATQGCTVCVQKDQEVHTWTKHLLLPVRRMSQRAQPPQVSMSVPCALGSMPSFAAESFASYHDVALLAALSHLFFLFHKEAASLGLVHRQDQLLNPRPPLILGPAQGLDAAVVAPWQARKD